MDDRIESTLNFIEKNIGRKISLNEISRAVYLSPYHLHRMFKAETGVALKKFIEMLKMEKAYHHTTVGDKKLKEVARDLGYRDYETFSRAFKRYHKVTPDILKAISEKLHQQLKGLQEHGNIIVVTNDTPDKKQISEKIKNKLAESGVHISEHTQIKTYVVQRVDDVNSHTPELIRNKYAIQKGGKVWQIVLEKIKHNEQTKNKK